MVNIDRWVNALPMNQFIGLVLLIITLIILAFDTLCRVVLCTIDPEYLRSKKSAIPCYSIYKYIKWKKELKK